MNTKIRDYKGEILVQLQELQLLNQKLNIVENFEQNYRQIIALLDKVSPSLMFYGVYNSGKSSLLNAIWGEEKASVADIPETHKVTYYHWDNFDLVDTPGINGPQEDFLISKEELHRHDVIMFVIDDSDTFDSAFVANEIVKIISLGKPLIIVLNNKQNNDEDVFEAIRSKLYDNVNKAAKKKSIDHVEHKYTFLTVNANMAYKGKQEGKKILIQNSRIEDLEILITEQLRLINEIKILIAPLDMALSSIKEFSEKLNERIKESDKKQFSNIIQEISDYKNNALNNLQALIKLEVRKYNQLLYSSIIAGTDIDSLQQNLSDKINSCIQCESEGFAAKCNIEFNVLINLPDIGLLINNIPVEVPISKPESKSYSDKNNDDTFDGILDNITKIPSIMMPPILPQIPVPMPIITAVVKGLFAIFRSKKDREQDLETAQAEVEAASVQARQSAIRRKNAMQEARIQINIQLHKFEQAALAVAQETIQQIYDYATAQLKKLVKDADSTLQNFVDANGAISEIEMKLNAIKTELK